MGNGNAACDSFEVDGWTFNKLQLEDKDMYSEYLRKTQYETNVFAWNFAYLWSESKNRLITWKVVNDMLVIFCHFKNGEIELWSLPFGEGDPEKVTGVLYQCLSFCHNRNAKNSSYGLARFIKHPQIEFLSGSAEFDRLFRVKKLKNIERVLEINKLLALQGKEYGNLRRKINQFHRQYPCAQIRDYSPADFDALVKLQRQWNKQSGSKYKTITDRIRLPEVLKHYNELDHLVLVVANEGEILGMVSGGISPTGCAWNFFIKAINEIPGIYEVMMVELARKINAIDPSVQLLNIGGDSGKKGLSYFKEKYRPVQRLETFRVTLK